MDEQVVFWPKPNVAFTPFTPQTYAGDRQLRTEVANNAWRKTGRKNKINQV